MRIIKSILFLLLFTSASVAMAQVGEHRRDFSVGVSGGMTMNRVEFNPRIKQKFKISPQFGIAARYVCEKYFNSICAVQLEVNYQDLGWNEFIEDIYDTNADDERIYTVKDNKFVKSMKYIEVPLLMQMGWGKEKKGFKFLFEAGPYIQYRIGMSEQKSGDPWRAEGYRPNNVTFQYYHDPDQKISYGIEAGIGLEHSSFLGHFLLEARYNYGLSCIFDDSKSAGNLFTRSANNTIEVKLTYLFDLIKTKE